MGCAMRGEIVFHSESGAPLFRIMSEGEELTQAVGGWFAKTFPQAKTEVAVIEPGKRVAITVHLDKVLRLTAEAC